MSKIKKVLLLRVCWCGRIRKADGKWVLLSSAISPFLAEAIRNNFGLIKLVSQNCPLCQTKLPKGERR